MVMSGVRYRDARGCHAHIAQADADNDPAGNRRTVKRTVEIQFGAVGSRRALAGRRRRDGSARTQRGGGDMEGKGGTNQSYAHIDLQGRAAAPGPPGRTVTLMRCDTT